jgi:alpha-glucosidase
MEKYIWHKHGVIYQIYPRSFLDTNGDGIGDLPGVIKKLDYIKSLGVDAIWLNPFFVSPMADFGYDIADFYTVDPIFGNNEDLLQLIQGCHQRGLKIILDMVFNHTSKDHPWFIESSSSENNPKRDWYIWNKTMPNNWQSLFGGSAWSKDENTGHYYYHFFLEEQPDLNLRNPEVINEIKKILRHYMDLGVDGFRLDATNTYFEDENLTDNPDSDYCPAEYTIDCQLRKYNFDHHSNYDFLHDIKALVDTYPGDKMLIGEVAKDGVDKSAWKKYYGTTAKGVDLVFNFDLLYDSFSGPRIIDVIKQWESLEGDAWPSYVFSSHDQVRAVSRFYSKEDTSETKILKSKLMTVLLLTVRGTPFIYYGQEITMPQYEGLSREQIQDPWAIRTGFRVPTRDGCRTPMLWNDSKNAGFSEANATWLPISPNHKEINVEVQESNQDSILNFYKKMLEFRKSHSALYAGELEIIAQENPNLVVYKRYLEKEQLLIVMNFSNENADFKYDSDSVLLSEKQAIPNQIASFGWLIIKQG